MCFLLVSTPVLSAGQGWRGWNETCNVAGIPAVTVPCGLAEDGLPAGLQLAAGLHREALLLSVARAYEGVSA